MLSADPVFQEFHGRGVAERGIKLSAVVERFDVVEQIGLRSGPRAVAGAMHLKLSSISVIYRPTIRSQLRRQNANPLIA